MYLQLHDPAFLAVASGGTPALDLFFSATKALDSRITFTRASTATFVNASGLVESAASGSARFTHSPTTLASLGLLIEESRTNLLTYSEQIENAAWTASGGTASANQTSAPSGEITADLFTENSAASTQHRVFQSPTLSNATAYTASVFVKRASGTRNFGIVISYGGAVSRVYFDLGAGTVATVVSGSGTITAYPGGWYRCTATGTTAATSGSVFFQMCNGTAFGSETYTGDGSSGVYLWGAQLEAGAFGSSYIPTTSATVTRAADVATMTGTNFSSWYNSSEGTFAVAYRPQQLGLYQQILQVDDGTLNNRAPSLSQRDTNFARLDWSSGGTTQISNFLASGSISLANTLVATSYKIGVGGSIAANGTVNASATAITTPTVDRLVIGNRSATNAYLNAPIARIRYYRRRLPDANLQTLTT